MKTLFIFLLLTTTANAAWFHQDLTGQSIYADYQAYDMIDHEWINGPTVKLATVTKDGGYPNLHLTLSGVITNPGWQIDDNHLLVIGTSPRSLHREASHGRLQINGMDGSALVRFADGTFDSEVWFYTGDTFETRHQRMRGGAILYQRQGGRYQISFTNMRMHTSPVPEPSTLALLSAATPFLLWRRRR